MKRHVPWLILLACAGPALAQDEAGQRVIAGARFKRGTHDGTEVGGLSHNLAGGGLRLASRAPATIEHAGPSALPYQQPFELPRSWPGGPLEVTFTLRPPEGMPRCPWLHLSADVEYRDGQGERLAGMGDVFGAEPSPTTIRLVLNPPKGTAKVDLQLAAREKAARQAIAAHGGKWFVENLLARRPRFVPRGRYVSEAVDLGGAGRGVKLAWLAEAPAGTAARFWVRHGKAPDALGPWREVSESPALLLALPGRYLQYRVELTTRDEGVTPCVRRMAVSWLADAGAITGRVQHATTGAPVGRARVSAGQREALTGPDGRFVLLVPAGQHRLRAERFGYQALAAAPLTVAAGQSAERELRLRPRGDWPIPRGSLRHLGQTFLSGTIRSPRLLWRYDLGPTRAGQVVTEDLDGDGRREILVVARCRVFAYAPDGKLLWKTPPALGTSQTRILGVHDLDKDGKREIVVVSPGYQTHARALVLSAADGSVLWQMDRFKDQWVNEPTAKAWRMYYGFLDVETSRVVDLNGDGYLDFICHPDGYRYLRAVDFSRGVGRARILYDADLRHSNLHMRQLAVADLDGDGGLELVANPGLNTLVVLDAATGRFLCEHRHGRRTNSSPLLAANLDKDAGREILFVGGDGTRMAFDYDHGALKPKWRRPGPGGSWRFRAQVADLDGDGLDEMLLDEPDGLAVWNADGRRIGVIDGCRLADVQNTDGKPGLEILVTRNRKRACFALAEGKLVETPQALPAEGVDLDGDGGRERVVNGRDGVLRVLEADGSERFSVPTGRFAHRNLITFLAALAADLDGDGATEVVMQDARGGRAVLDAHGASLEQPPRLVGRLAPAMRVPQLVDLDADGRLELLGAGIYRIERDAKEGFRLRRDETLAPPGASKCTTGDFDGDGAPDRLLLFETAHGRPAHCVALSGTSERPIWRGGMTPYSPFNYYYPGVADVTGDGADDLFGKVCCIGHLKDGRTGRTLWTRRRSGMCACGLAAIEDLDGDGELDVAYTGGSATSAWTGRSGRAFFRPLVIKFAANKGRYGTLADVNGDGAWELGLAAAHGSFYCADGATGRVRWAFDVPGRPDLSNPCAADIDGDGRMEFLFGAADGRLYCLNGEDGSVCWTHDFGEAVGDPIVADVDDDGLAEVLVPVDGYLCCLGSAGGS